MNKDLFLSTLGLARRAGKLCRGFESTVENAGIIDTVFLANDCSDRTRKTISEIFAELNKQPVNVNYSKFELGVAIGTKPVGIIGVTDAGFAKLLKTRLFEEVV